MLSEILSEVFSHPTYLGAAIIVLKTAIVYLFLVIGLRLLGRRELGQMNVYDVVLLMVLANAVQNAMVGDDNTLFGGLVAGVTLLVLNRSFTYAMNRSKKLSRLMVGEPLLIVNHGVLLEDKMHKEGITREQVMAALREHGMSRLEEVRICVVEIDGTMSVVPCTAQAHRTKHHYKALRLS